MESTNKTPPEHIAIIMDGNSRWAKERGLSTTEGHKAGAGKAEEIVKICAKLGLKNLTLYAFSTENFSRSESEVNQLFSIMLYYLQEKPHEIIDNNIRIKFIGEINSLPPQIQQGIQSLEQKTVHNTGMNLFVALNYGGRQEILQAVNAAISNKLANNNYTNSLTLELDDINNNLYYGENNEPDLLIRTGGDMRVSNFLLWQIAYTELYFSNCFWPDFTVNNLEDAITDFNNRKRRFGLR